MIWLSLLLVSLGLGIWLLVFLGRGASEHREIRRRFSGETANEASSKRGVQWPARFSLNGDREFAHSLARLGWSSPRTVSMAYMAWLGVTAAGCVSGMGLGLLRGMSQAQLITLTLVGLAVGFLGFKRFLGWLAARRASRMVAELPMVIQLLRLLLNAGLAYEMAMRKLADEGLVIAPELGGELQRALHLTDGGFPLAEALSDMGQRLDVPEISRFLGLLRQLITLGGSVDRSLANLADDLANLRENRLREQVNKAAGQMSLVMMLFLFPALLVLLAGPAIIVLGRGLFELSS